MTKLESCIKANHERWNPTIPKATHEGVSFIGDQSLECDVLPDGRRILRAKTFAKAMGRKRSGTKDKERAKMLNLPIFVCANNLTPYLEKEIHERGELIFYKGKNGQKLQGYDANFLPAACKVYTKADDDNLLQLQQKPIANVCRSILYSLASVGIVALIDEATGYQEARALDELQKILDNYISEELRGWTQKFPNEFFKQVYRLHGWEYPKLRKNHPQYVGQLINKYVYEKLPPGVIRYRYHQFLTESIGDKNLNNQIVQVITLMKVSKDLNEFNELMERT